MSATTSFEVFPATLKLREPAFAVSSIPPMAGVWRVCIRDCGVLLKTK